MGVVGFAGPPGATASTTYFLVDNFYPGGWPRALNVMNDLEKENQKIIPKFQIVPYGAKW